MKIGKLPESVLIRSVLHQTAHRREEVLVGPEVGQDCAVFRLAPDEVCVISSDPITGTVKDIGRHGIHITANDLAASGSDPLGVILTILLPEKVEEEELRAMMRQAEETCRELNIEIMGGHTEITRAVREPLITVTGVGRAKEKDLLITRGMRSGQQLVVTKWIGLEATSILAKEKEAELRTHFPESFLETAQHFDQYLSVVRDAQIARACGVSAMHDITEGGVFGALWEMAAAAQLGMQVELKSIPIRQETIEICEYFHLNPYQIMSSGSMLIAADDGEKLVAALKAEGIHAAVVGCADDGPARIIKNGEDVRYMDKPQADELYKVMG